MQVHYDEGVANHIGPEPCAGAREGTGEASAGVRIGQPLSRETFGSRVPTQLSMRKATRAGGVIASTRLDPGWSQTLACADALCTGTGRSQARPRALLGWRSVAGRRGAVAADGRT